LLFFEVKMHNTKDLVAVHLSDQRCPDFSVATSGRFVAMLAGLAPETVKWQLSSQPVGELYPGVSSFE